MPKYTVLAVYAETHQRYGDSVEAATPQEAERIARENADEPLIIAGVIRGFHDCADTYAYEENAGDLIYDDNGNAVEDARA